jgi:hypothetical protein
MKHKLFLCVLILVIVGLYCQNCVEFFTDIERDEIQTMLTNQIKSINVGDNQNKLDEIEERLKKELIDSGKCIGPKGAKGDTGGQTNVYQGLYSLRDSSKPFASIGKDKTGGYSDTTPSNNIIQLNPNNKSQFILTSKDRWQYTDKKTLVSGYNSEFTMCYNANGTDNGIYNCHKTKVEKPNSEFKNNFNYDGETQQFFISEDKKKCIELDKDKLVIGKDCDNSKVKEEQQFFLH